MPVAKHLAKTLAKVVSKMLKSVVKLLTQMLVCNNGNAAVQAEPFRDPLKVYPLQHRKGLAPRRPCRRLRTSGSLRALFGKAFRYSSTSGRPSTMPSISWRPVGAANTSLGRHAYTIKIYSTINLIIILFSVINIYISYIWLIFKYLAFQKWQLFFYDGVVQYLDFELGNHRMSYDKHCVQAKWFQFWEELTWKVVIYIKI